MMMKVFSPGIVNTIAKKLNEFTGGSYLFLSAV